jgi:hypothetical protein
MNMHSPLKYYFIFLLLTAAIVSSCKKTYVSPNETTDRLFQQFDGKYKLLYAQTNDPVDANLDGISSPDLRGELPDMQRSEVLVGIGSQFVFSQSWPEPYFSGAGIPTTYVAGMPPTYAMQGILRRIKFSEDLKQMLPFPDDPSVDQFRFPRPDSILLFQGERIQIHFHKDFYTPSGWKTSKVECMYLRYSK